MCWKDFSVSRNYLVLSFPATWTPIRMYTCSEGQDNLFYFANWFSSDGNITKDE